MAKKPTITTITSGYASNTQLNANFEALRAAFDNTISRDGSTPNTMSADLDLNGNDIINANSILVGGQDYLAQALAAKNAAETAQAGAETAETNAGTSETNAAASATSAAASATTATTAVASIGSSVSDAAASATAAASSASAADASAISAAANEALAVAAKDAAAISATSAATSATTASASATSAATSAVAANSAKLDAEAAFDAFDDRYLGAKSSAPTTDNDGDPLIAGALYYNTTAGQLYVWTGSAWDAAAFSAAGAVTSFNTRTGAVTLSSTDVSGASGLLSTNNLSDLGDAATARTNLGLSTVAETGAYSDLSGLPTLGTAAATASTDYATAAQGALAATALQDITGESIQNLSDVATMSPTTDQVLSWNGSAWTAADMNALVSGDNVSELVNDAGYLTSAPSPFAPTTVSGTTPSLDLSSYNYFEQGALTGDTTLTFASAPTNARFTYVYEPAFNTSDVTDITTAVLQHNVSASPQSSFSSGSFSQDGLVFFAQTERLTTGYTLTKPYDLSTAISQGSPFDSSAAGPADLANGRFSSDGTKFFMLTPGSDSVAQFNMSTAYDATTLSHSSNFSVTAQDTSPLGLAFSSDGTKMYICGSQNDSVYQYTLSTAWDLSTASYASKSFSVSGQTTVGGWIDFSADGTDMYFIESNSPSSEGVTMFQYALSTAWDVSTASYASKTISFDGTAALGGVGFFVDTANGVWGVATPYTDGMRVGTLGSSYTLTLPGTVNGTPTNSFNRGNKVALEFVTTDGGTSYELISQTEVTA